MRRTIRNYLVSISAVLCLVSFSNPKSIYDYNSSFINAGKIKTFNNFKNPAPYQSNHPAKTIASSPFITIYLDGTPTNLEISKATLKYNKNFAYSFTLDDGKENGYTAAYPLFKGGYSSETGQNYPGVFYTDGCGTNIPFKAGLAINSVNSSGEDTHINTPGILTWDQISELHDNGWDILNHSYSHHTGPGTNYNAEVTNNVDFVKSKTGIDMTHFVIPSGDIEYATYAFNAGMSAVYNQGGNFPGVDGLQVDGTLSLNQFKLYRQFIADDTYDTYSTKIDQIASKSSVTKHFWYTEFTHHVAASQQGGSLLFSRFKSHMEKIETSYGVKGADNMWMAPLQEVYEYLSVREKTTLIATHSGNMAYADINFDNVPNGLRRYAITLVVKSDKTISNVECPGASKISFNGTGSTKIINLEWNQHPSEITGTMDDLLMRNDFNVYPNPVENSITLSFPGNTMKKVYITVINEQGIENRLGESVVADGKTTVDLKKLELKKGAYVLRIDSEDGRYQYRKVIIKN